MSWLSAQESVALGLIPFPKELEDIQIVENENPYLSLLYNDTTTQDKIMHHMVTRYHHDYMGKKEFKKENPEWTEEEIEWEMKRRRCMQHKKEQDDNVVYGHVPCGGRERQQAPTWPPDMVKKRKFRNDSLSSMSTVIPIRSKLCTRCKTQEAPLWRKGWNVSSSNGGKSSSVPVFTTTSTLPASELVDLCQMCYIKWSRGLLVKNSKKKTSKKSKKKKSKMKKKESLEQHITEEISEDITTSLEHTIRVPVETMQQHIIKTTMSPHREKELRAAGQYCPVCTACYEDDDIRSFIFCDVCEMWIHADCDSTLDP